MIFRHGKKESEMISRKLREAVILSEMKSYQIAHAANLHPSTLSRIICGIEKVKKGDPRVISIGRVLGIPAEDCFQNKIDKRR